jgi:hypothetical protein
MSRLLLMVAVGALAGPRAWASHSAAAPEPAGTGEIEQLAATADRLFAIRDGAVLTFDGSGSLIGRCGHLPAVPPRSRPRPFRTLDPAEILHDAGLPDDDGTLAAEEALDDEAASPRPARASPEPPAIRPRALAAAAGRVWAATGDGLFRVAPEGCRRAGLPGRDLLVVAASPTVVAAASADLLFAAEAQEQETQEEQDLAEAPAVTWRFRAIAALVARPRALAIDADGRILVADDEGLMRVDRGGERTRLLADPARALAACGGIIAALAANAVYTWDGGQLTRAGDAPPARLLACGTAQRRWVAAGAGVWSSPDATLWTGHAQALGARVTALAVVGGRAWIAADDGLTAVSLDPGELPGLPEPLPAVDLAPPRARATAAPSWIWPELGALVTVDRTLTRRTVTAFLLLRFPFDRPPPPRGDQSALALQAALRDAALVRTQLAAGAAAAAAADVVDRDEAAARREMAAAEREALR